MVCNYVGCGVYPSYLDGLNRLFTIAVYGTYEWQPGKWASCFYNYYYSILINKLNFLLSCPRVRVYGKGLPRCQVATSERQIIGLRVSPEDDALLVGLHLFGSTLDDEVATDAVIAHSLEAKLVEGKSYPCRVQFLADACADNLYGSCGGHENAVLALFGDTKIQSHQLSFEMGCLKLFVMMVQLLDFVFRKPVLETALVEGKGLAVDAFVVERMVTRADDTLHLERKPTAVACRVGQKLSVIASAAERGDMFSVLMEMGVGGRSSMLGMVTAAFNWLSSAGRMVSSSSQQTRAYWASVNRSSFDMRLALVLV